MANEASISAAPSSAQLQTHLSTLASLLTSLSETRSSLLPLLAAVAGSSRSDTDAAFFPEISRAERQGKWKLAVGDAARAVKSVKSSVEAAQESLAAAQASSQEDPANIVVAPSGPPTRTVGTLRRTKPHAARRRVRAPLPMGKPSPRSFEELEAFIKAEAPRLEVERAEERGKAVELLLRSPGVMRIALELRWRDDGAGRGLVIERGTAFALHETNIERYQVSAFGVFRSVTRCLHATIAASVDVLGAGQSNLTIILSFLESYANMFDGSTALGPGLMPKTRRVWRRDARVSEGEDAREGWDAVGDEELV